MEHAVIAEVVERDGRQMIVVPEEFHVDGTHVELTRDAGGMRVSPLRLRGEAWFAAMDSCGADEEPIPGGRNQPPMQERDFSGVFD